MIPIPRHSSLASLLLVLAALGLVGCATPSSSNDDNTPGNDQNAGGDTGNGGALPSSFQADRAFALIEAQVAFGPRNPGSQGHAECLEFLVEELGSVTDHVERQEFTHTSSGVFPGQTFQLTNVIGTIESSMGSAAPRLLLCAHWDTRPFADQDPTPANRTQPVLGANDGASGVAVVLELARVFKASRPPANIIIVLFDGEDFGASGNLTEWFLGSRYFAANMGDFRPDQGILLDMVGDADLKIDIDGYSLNSNPQLLQRIWAAAELLGYSEHFASGEEATAWVHDDHLALINAGVPTVDLIDFDYDAWHTVEDTVDKCSPTSLRAVGETVEHVVREGF